MQWSQQLSQLLRAATILGAPHASPAAAQALPARSASGRTVAT